MIYAIWYPSGGFGHYLNAVISTHGEDFVKPDNELKFSNTGDSHSMNLVAPKFFMDPTSYSFNFCSDKNYTLLIDNGIASENQNFLNVLPADQKIKVVKVVYSDHSWPIVAQTMSVKAMQSTVEDVAKDGWTLGEDWAIREKYFLFLRDNQLRFKWKNDLTVDCIDVSNFLDYKQLYTSIRQTGIALSDFSDLHISWKQHNSKYFQAYNIAADVIKAVRNKTNLQLDNIVDTWIQSVIYYYIWLEFNFEIPHNDYSNFFTDTKEIAIMLEQHGVTIDPD